MKAIFLSFLVGCTIDVIWNSIFENSLPQISPLFMLFPMAAMYKSAKYDGLIKLEKIVKNEVIVTWQDRMDIFKNLSIAFFLGGILSLGSGYVLYKRGINDNFNFSIVNTFILISISLLLGIVQRIKKESLKEKLSILILLLSIPLVVLRFSEYASITLWGFPIIIMMSALLFTKKILLVSTAIVSIITQRLLWIIKPEVFVTINAYDYILRIFGFILIYLIGSYVNETYVSKIKENNYQIELQKLNSEILFQLMTINKDNLDKKADIVFSRIGSFFKVDKAYVIIINNEDDTVLYFYEWQSIGERQKNSIVGKIPITKFSWWIEQLEEYGFVHIEDFKKMPQAAKVEYDKIITKNTKSLVLVPIKGDQEMRGVIGLNSEESFKSWSDHEINFLKIVANIFANGISKAKAESKVEFMAYFDKLTKLPNKTLFQDRVEQAIKTVEREGKFISVIFMDLDNFKTVNDTIGHSGGDTLLVKVSQRIVGQVRKSDTVARFGGDEFMILLNNVSEYRDSEKIIKNIMGIFKKTFIVDGHHFFITASAGIANYPIDGKDAKTLIKNADMSMYEAKFKGKNQYAVCNTLMKTDIKKSILLSNDLQKALDKDELTVCYQPQIDLKTGEINGLEALLRWKHPKFGVIAPEVFIKLAEKNNLINKIGEWVLKTACSQNKKWQDMGLAKYTMAVNLSTMQFTNPGIVGNIENILIETNLNPKYLELEITESVAIKETNSALNVLEKFKKIGVSLSIDDFGTEYSSLSRLKILPIDKIKIDMQFVQGIEKDKKDRAITTVIISLAKNLGLKVLAEGVETKAQLDFLVEKGCDYGQGYYFYNPMEACDIEKILIRNRF